MVNYLCRANYLNRENCYLSQKSLLATKHDGASDTHFRYLFRSQAWNFGKIVKYDTYTNIHTYLIELKKAT